MVLPFAELMPAFPWRVYRHTFPETELHYYFQSTRPIYPRILAVVVYSMSLYFFSVCWCHLQFPIFWLPFNANNGMPYLTTASLRCHTNKYPLTVHTIRLLSLYHSISSSNTAVAPTFVTSTIFVTAHQFCQFISTAFVNLTTFVNFCHIRARQFLSTISTTYVAKDKVTTFVNKVRPLLSTVILWS